MQKIIFIFLLIIETAFNQCLGDPVCSVCSYDYFDINYLYKTQTNQSSLVLSDCHPKISVCAFNCSRKILILSENQNFDFDSYNFTAVYYNFFEALGNETYIASQYFGMNLTFYLFSQENSTMRKGEKNVFFQRLKSNITINPLFCSFLNVTGCLGDNEKIKIYFEEINFALYVSTYLRISNIIISQRNIIAFQNTLFQKNISMFIMDGIFDDLNYKLPILVMEKINFENMTFDENILDSIIYVSKFHGILLCNNVKFINVDLNVCFLTYDNRNIYNEELGNNFFQKYFFLLRNARINFQNLSFINSNCLGEYLFYMYFWRGQIGLTTIQATRSQLFSDFFIFIQNVQTIQIFSLIIESSQFFFLVKSQNSQLILNKIVLNNSFSSNSSILYSESDNLQITSLSMLNTLFLGNNFQNIFLLQNTIVMISSMNIFNVYGLKFSSTASTLNFSSSNFQNFITSVLFFIVEGTLTFWSSNFLNVTIISDIVQSLFLPDLILFAQTSFVSCNFHTFLITSETKVLNLTEILMTNTSFFQLLTDGHISNVIFSKSLFTNLNCSQVIYLAINIHLIFSDCIFKNISLIGNQAFTFYIDFTELKRCVFDSIVANLHTAQIIDMASVVGIVRESKFINIGWKENFYNFVFEDDNSALNFWFVNINMINNLFVNENMSHISYMFFYAQKSVLNFENNTLMSLNNGTNLFHNGIVFLEVMSLNLKNNVFYNLKCPDLLKKRLTYFYINGPIAFLGEKNTLKTLLAKNNSFYKCECQNGGTFSITLYGEAKLINTTIITSSAVTGGAFTLSNMKNVVIENLMIKNSFAKQGGGIFMNGIDFVAIINLIFSNCSGVLTGVMKASRVQNLSLNNVYGNTLGSQKYGGLIFASDSNISLINVFINKSSAAMIGGVVYLQNCFYSYFNNVTFINSISGNIGTIIYLDSIIYSMLNNIKALGSISLKKGGIFYFDSVPNVRIYDLLCFASQSKAPGLLISRMDVSNYKTMYFFEKMLFYENFLSFSDGTFIGIDYSDFLYISNCKLANNSGNFLSLSDSQLIYISDIFLSKNDNHSQLIDLTQTSGFFFNVSLNFQKNFENPFKLSLCPYFKISILNITSSLSKRYEMFKFYNSMIYLCQMYLNVSYVMDLSLILTENSLLFFSDCALFVNFISQIYELITLYNSHLIISKADFYSLTTLLLYGYESNVALFEVKILDTVPVFNQSTIIFLQIHPSSLNSNDFFLFIKDSLFNSSLGTMGYVDSYRKLITNNLTIINPQAKENKGFLLYEVSKILIKSSIFKNLSSTQGSALYISNLNTPIFLIFKNCNFLYCTSNLGGAISVLGNFSFLLLDSTFKGNQALRVPNNIYSGIAGCVYLNSYSAHSKAIISNNLFFFNKGFYYGSTVVSGIRPKLNSNIFSQNWDNANTTSDSLSYPFDVKHINYSNNTESMISFKSGLPFSVSFVTMDSFQNVLTFDETSVANFKANIFTNQSSDNDFAFTNNLAKSKKGIFMFPSLIIKTFSGRHYKLLFYMQFNEDLSGTPTIFKKLFDFYALPCSIGEIIKPDKSCVRCAENTFFLQEPNQNQTDKCLDCPDNAICPGGSLIIPNPGFWRRSTQSSMIVKCLLAIACPNTIDVNLSINLNFTGVVCAEGNFGNVCFECMEGYGQYTTGSTCEKCKNIDSSVIARMIIVSLVVIIYIFFNSKSLIQDTDENLNNIIMKIMINHLQRTSIILVFNIQNLIDDLKGFFDFLNALSFLTQDLYSNSCFIQMLGMQNKGVYQVKIVFSLFLPLFFSLFCLFISHFNLLMRRLLFRCKLVSVKNNKTHKFTNELLLYLLIALFLFYSLIINGSFSLYNCFQIDDVKNNGSIDTFLLVSPNIQCWTMEHKKLLIFSTVFGVIMWGIGFPCVLTFLLKRKNMERKSKVKFERTKQMKKMKSDDDINIFMINSNALPPKINRIDPNNMKKPEMAKKFKIKVYFAAFFFKDYKSSYYYWECVIFFQKFLMILLSNIYEMNAEYTDLVFFAMFFFYFRCVIKLKPFKAFQINNLDALSVGVSISTRFFCIFALVFPNLKYIIFILTIFFNSAFFCFSVFLMIKYTKWKIMYKKGLNTVVNLRKFVAQRIISRNSRTSKVAGLN